MVRSIHLVAGILILIFVAAIVMGMAVYQPDSHDETKLKVICAGSLIESFYEFEKEFENKHPGVDVQVEGHGSIQVIRHVTDLHKEVDVLAVADHSLIPDMMYPEYADWYIAFATNEMVIAYSNQSKYADEITSDNWYEILKRPGVTFGFSNPMLDSCGYRALMVTQLAELYYDDQTIFDDVVACNFDPAIAVSTNNDTCIVVMPEIFEHKTEKIVIRGGSIQLLAFLDYGEIDYAFQYKSMAQQHGLQFVDLPCEIDLSSTESEDIYNKVIIQLGFQRFTSVGTERSGKPIFYAMTIPNSTQHPKLAVEFVKFVLSEDGQGILHNTKIPPIYPMADDLDNIPDELRLMDIIYGPETFTLL
ncbi:MAG: tungstate ABC transporter substrate-binding protein WtpA [Methanosarcinales archaeon]|nr:tungstate ABC transporter substrate-binding protein WtpA [Methanosarcinales archaeon]